MKTEIALALWACAMLLSFKNSPVLIYTKLHLKSCYYLLIILKIKKGFPFFLKKKKKNLIFIFLSLQLISPSSERIFQAVTDQEVQEWVTAIQASQCYVLMGFFTFLNDFIKMFDSD